MASDVFEIPGIRLAQGIGLRMEPVSPNSVLWRCRVAMRRGPWTTLYPAHAGFPTLEEAIAATDERLSALQAAQEEASAAEVVYYLRAGRLTREAREVVAGQDGPIEQWRARAEDSTEGVGDTPEAAVRAAKAAALESASQRGLRAVQSQRRQR